jgi:hypothetical protein
VHLEAAAQALVRSSERANAVRAAAGTSAIFAIAGRCDPRDELEAVHPGMPRSTTRTSG